MSLTIRAYNVLFGDCLLVSWDESDGEHHAWIDFGNFHNDPNAVFTPVYNDVLERTEGKLDLVVISHRHMDHLEGFYSLRSKFEDDFEISRLWYAHVTPALEDQFEMAERAIRGLIPDSVRIGDGDLARIYRNNFGVLGLTIVERMERVLDTLQYDEAHAVHRETNVQDVMPPGVSRLKIEILAPEQDSSVYFEPLEHPLQTRARLDAHFERAAQGVESPGGNDPFASSSVLPAIDSPLMKLADFARLRRKLRTGGLDLLGAVDKTRNNTSMVLRLTYSGKRLLLAADAEEKSWELMRNNDDVNLSSHLMKVSHHGSINASPSWSYREVITRRRQSNAALVSTDRTRYTGTNEVPKEEVVDGWRDRLSNPARLLRTDSVALGESVAITY